MLESNIQRKSGTASGGISRTRAQRPRCIFQRNPEGLQKSGVDFWHAVEFSRNEPLPSRPLTGPLRALPVQSVSSLSDPRFPLFRPPLAGFFLRPLGAFRLYHIRLTVSSRLDATTRNRPEKANLFDSVSSLGD